jgi:hypothetical protein
MSERNPDDPPSQRIPLQRVDRCAAGAYLGRTTGKETAMTEDTLSVPVDELRVDCRAEDPWTRFRDPEAVE